MKPCLTPGVAHLCTGYRAEVRLLEKHGPLGRVLDRGAEPTQCVVLSGIQCSVLKGHQCAALCMRDLSKYQDIQRRSEATSCLLPCRCEYALFELGLKRSPGADIRRIQVRHVWSACYKPRAVWTSSGSGCANRARRGAVGRRDWWGQRPWRG